MTKLKNIFLKLILHYLLFVILSLYSNTIAKGPEPEWNIKLQIGSIYDSNILKYSDKYIEKYNNNEDEGRFHINRYDDLIIHSSIQTSYNFRLIKKLNSIVSGGIRHRTYTLNSIKNWYLFNISWRQYLSKKFSLKIIYSYIPEFYVRHFRDGDWIDKFGYEPITFQPYSFSKDNYSFLAQYSLFKNTLLKMSFSFMDYYHNEHYTEYDSNNYLYGFNVSHSLDKKIKLNVGYRYLNSDANGYDNTNETKISSDDSDASYTEDIFILGCEWRLPKLFGHSNNVSVESKYQKRYYSSKHFPLEDRLHAGRIDDNFRLFVSYKYYLQKDLNLKLFYNLFYRDSDTKAEENKIYVSDEKAYDQYQIGLLISYSFRL